MRFRHHNSKVRKGPADRQTTHQTSLRVKQALGELAQVVKANKVHSSHPTSQAAHAIAGRCSSPGVWCFLLPASTAFKPTNQLTDHSSRPACAQVVAFIKGTRSQPQCGFSHKLLTILNDSRADYEVVNVLDDFHNPGLREAIKTYSQWPTIPQLYVAGEFVGGSDIVEQMQASGELAQLLVAAK